MYMLCRPAGYSWPDFRAVATEDKRQVNPGFLAGPHEDGDGDGDAPWAGAGEVEHGAGRGKGE